MSELVYEAVRRVLIALPGARYRQAPVPAAARLAARLQAELQALFVEEEDLLRCAGLPFAREVPGVSGEPRHLRVDAMARALRGIAAEMERSLAQAASRAGVPWSFRVVRGRVLAELLALGDETDLILLRYGGPLPAGAAIRARSGGSVLVAYEASPAGERAVRAAATLAHEEGAALVVLAPGERGASAVRERAAVLLQGSGVRWSVQSMRAHSPAELLEVDRDTEALVVTLGSLRREDLPALERWLTRLGCTLLIVR
ncbi:MAG: hypothetical protein GWO02_08895 [Gammaproteobacteria bacterium]|nr:hypothetical protein [Gammaproteobacteria bacterium]